MKSTVVFVGEGDKKSVRITLSTGAQWWACWLRREIEVSAHEIIRIYTSDSKTVGRMLRWKIAGAGFSRQRLMGWFSWVGNRGRWAWVWMTPGREMIVIETTRRRPALIAVPADWQTP
ncbi:MAG: hypothetical protein EBU84_18405 [Actinobacteria bacterium]|nr:hypothetical protein [Actinomycetota bacterium]